MGGLVIFSSAGRSSAFLEWAWVRRESMNDSERHGLCQAIYAALLGHIEATMYSLLKDVNRRAKLAINYNAVGLPDPVVQARGAVIPPQIQRTQK